MGLHGYRIGVGEYGRLPWDRRCAHMMMDPYHGRFLGWTPRNQEGFHMRRVGGAMFMQGAPLVPERPVKVAAPCSVVLLYSKSRSRRSAFRLVLSCRQGVLAPKVLLA